MGGFLNGRARRLGPFSTAGARRLRAFVHYRSSHNRAKRDCGLYSLFCITSHCAVILRCLLFIGGISEWHEQLLHHLCRRFLLLCSFVLVDASMTCDAFAEHLLSSALAMHKDAVPNTRIVLARLLAQHILKSCE